MTSISKLRFEKKLSELTVNDIQLLIDNRIDESQNLDYKQPSDDLQNDTNKLAEVISSFLNTDGGIIVYGVTETRDKEGHRFPCNILWSKETKERIENLLISRVQLWSEDILIQRIANEKNPIEGLYIIEVPKSNNPPHMCNNIYYQRYNFQNKPMSHESVYRVFQTSWIRRRDIVTRIVEPLYSEIKCVVEDLYEYKLEGQQPDSYYQEIKISNRFLYDLLSKLTQTKIEEFYDRVHTLGIKIGFAAYQIVAMIVNQELAESYPNQKEEVMKLPQSQETILLYYRMKDFSGVITGRDRLSFYWSIIRKQSIQDFLEQQFYPQIMVDYKPSIQSLNISMSESEFKEFWERCERKARQDARFISIWNERDELIELGHQLLRELTKS
jgi:hypothetical protein